MRDSSISVTQWAVEPTALSDDWGWPVVTVTSNRAKGEVRGNVLNCTGSHVFTDHSFQVTSMREIT